MSTVTTMNLNLLPSQAKFQAVKIRLQKIVLNIIIGLVVAWSFVVAAVIGVNVWTKYRLDNTNLQYKKAFDNYKSMADSIVTNQNLKYKAKMVGGVLKDRFEYGKSFELIQNLFPAGIILKNYDLREGGVFVITGFTQTQENVDLLENTVIDINTGTSDKLKSARLDNLTLKGGDWSFTLEVTLK